MEAMICVGGIAFHPKKRVSASFKRFFGEGGGGGGGIERNRSDDDFFTISVAGCERGGG